jgi:hypothetical protein
MRSIAKAAVVMSALPDLWVLHVSKMGRKEKIPTTGELRLKYLRRDI